MTTSTLELACDSVRFLRRAQLSLEDRAPVNGILRSDFPPLVASCAVNSPTAPMTKISFVFPVFNEEGNIARLYAELRRATDGRPEFSYEFVFVNDASTDRSLELLEDLAERDHRVVVVDFSRNFGHQVAITAGIDHASGDAVVLMDSDLQDPPDVALELIDKWREGYEVVYAERRSRTDTVFKRATAAGFYWLLDRLSDTPIPRNTGDFRLMDRRVVDELQRFTEHNRFVRGMVSFVGFRQTAVQFDRADRLTGDTKYPLKKMLKFAADGILGFSTAPLRLIGRVGVLIAGLAFLGGLYALGVKLLAPERAVAGWTFIMISVLLVGGVQLIMLGVLGGYLGRVYTEAQNRPLYIVRSVRRSQRLPADSGS